MIIRQSQNGSITERKTSPFKKKIHLLSEKIYNEISSYKKNSYRNDIFKKPSIKINNYENNNNDFQNKTIIPINQKYHHRIKFRALKNKHNINPKKALNKEISKLNYDDKKINYNELFDNNSDKENINNIPQTSRYDNNIKEKYLAKFFKNYMDSKFSNNLKLNKIKEINIKNIMSNPFMETINAHSKRNNSTYINQINKENIDNENESNNDIMENESIINLEDELNYEFEIRLLRKRYKELKKKNNKLKYKLYEVKNEIKKKQNKENKKTHLISKVVDICKNINFSEKNNFFTSYNETYNGYTTSNIESKESKNDIPFPATKLFKNMLLNLMDVKYEYENIYLKNEFILGLKNMLINYNENKDGQINEKFIFKNIKDLLKEEIKFKAIINQLKYLSIENKKYYEYFSKLCKKLNIHSLDNLEEFLKNTIIKASAEYKQINQIKNIVMGNHKNNSIDNKIIKNRNNNDNFKEIDDCYYIIDEPRRTKIKSESKININISSVKKEDINSKRYSYFKDNKYMNESLITNNIFGNKNNSIPKKMLYTYKCNDSAKKSKNLSMIKQKSNEKFNLYDFSKQKDYDYYHKDYYNDNNKKLFQNKNIKNNANVNNNKRIEVSHCIKNIKIYPFKENKTKNKNYNNIINFKKKELGLNQKIKKNMKLNTNDNNKKVSKSHNKDFCFFNNN